MTNMICLNEVSIKKKFYKTCVKNYVDLSETKRIYINFDQVLGMYEKVYKTESGEDVNVTNILFIYGGNADVLESDHEIMQKVKAGERNKHETRTAWRKDICTGRQWFFKNLATVCQTWLYGLETVQRWESYRKRWNTECLWMSVYADGSVHFRIFKRSKG